MLKLVIPGSEAFDEETETFIYTKERTLHLEHSLVSLSKWEAVYQIPFLTEKQKTTKQTLDYIRFMTITQNVDPEIYKTLPSACLNKVEDYIRNPMTATTISNRNKKGGRQIITSEVIYGWMVVLHIPFECEKWHLNRLLTLIQVCNELNNPGKKMSKKELLERNRALNEARKVALNTRG